MKFDIDKQDEKIKEKYRYYRKIGLEEKVAIVLTMYTYGGFGFIPGTIDELKTAMKSTFYSQQRQKGKGFLAEQLKKNLFLFVLPYLLVVQCR